MLVFCHLLIGTMLGLLLYRSMGDRRVVLAAALGAILPDIIDKPLGHLLLQSTLDSGRIFAHSLLFLGMITLVGVVAWRSKLTPLVLVLAVGVASHLVLDTMWDNPVTLLWPALGPFQPYHYPGYFENSFVTEITSPLEWLFGASFLIIITALYHDKLGSWEGLVERVRAIRLPLFALLAVVGGLSIVALLFSPVDAVDLPPKLMAGACAIVGGGFLFIREKRGELLEAPEEGSDRASPSGSR
ncbi:MAG: metal-dependent hydrolase [Methanomassiliicoccus sp.]|nr:metal-dependent hydrolase [Methanomassiliicoccus sp.]